MVEYSAFNRFVPGSNPGQPIYKKRSSIQYYSLSYRIHNFLKIEVFLYTNKR